MSLRRRLVDAFVATLGDIDVARVMRRQLETSPVHAGESCIVIAFGKAARPMASALLASLPKATAVRGLLVPPAPDEAPLDPLTVIPGGHPLPTDDSVRAARAALALARSAGPTDDIVFLVSGGGSAMLELPAIDGVPVAAMRELYSRLVGCGGDIVEINTVRRWFSAVKGGRLAAAARRARFVTTLAVSDVPEDQPAALASGPAIADSSTVDDCRAVLDRFDLWNHVPEALRRALRAGALPAPLRDGDELLRRSEHREILANRHAREALTRHVAALDIETTEDLGVDDLPFDVAAHRLLDRVDEMAQQRPDRPVALLTGGEVTVRLPATPGVGGRNQQFVLACVERIAGRPITVLSAGTDGIDGNSDAAGAVADGTTLERARAAGLDPGEHLRRCNAQPLFEALGDTVVTGPTGQNVRDLRLIVHTPKA